MSQVGAVGGGPLIRSRWKSGAPIVITTRRRRSVIYCQPQVWRVSTGMLTQVRGAAGSPGGAAAGGGVGYWTAGEFSREEWKFNFAASLYTSRYNISYDQELLLIRS